jgi:hypothetical protein
MHNLKESTTNLDFSGEIRQFKKIHGDRCPERKFDADPSPDPQVGIRTRSFPFVP